jgi:hypothetical protein
MSLNVQTPCSLCRFGMARVEITPPVGIYHRMWGAATHDQSTGVHRPLFATALVFRGADEEQVLITLDHCLLWAAEMDALLERVCNGNNLAREQVSVTFSHTHGAGLMGLERADLPGGSLIPPYLDRLGEAVADLVAMARVDVQPATITYGSGACAMAAHRDLYDPETGQWVCGFNPEKAADNTVLVARITDESGKTIVTLVNYGCHPTTLAWDNTLISPDYPGALRETVEEATGAPCVFVLSPCGETGPKEGFVGDVDVADRNGRQVGYAALSALESLPPPQTRFEYTGPVVSGATIGTWKHVPLKEGDLQRASRFRCRRWTIELPYPPDRLTAEEMEAERTRWLEAETAAHQAGDESRARDCRALAERMTRALARHHSLPAGTTFPYPVTLLQLGDAVWLIVEGEPYQKLQTELRNRFPGTPIVIGVIGNGSRCSYLPPEELYGNGIYQESVAVLAPGSLEKLIEELETAISNWFPDRETDKMRPI